MQYNAWMHTDKFICGAILFSLDIFVQQAYTAKTSMTKIQEHLPSIHWSALCNQLPPLTCCSLLSQLVSQVLLFVLSRLLFIPWDSEILTLLEPLCTIVLYCTYTFI